MEIKDNGFYDLREIEDNKIIVSSGVQANFFDSKKDRIIILNENSNIGYYNLVIDKKTNIKIFHTGNKSKSEVSCLLISNDKINGELNISVDIKNSNCYSKLHIYQ